MCRTYSVTVCTLKNLATKREQHMLLMPELLLTLHACNCGLQKNIFICNIHTAKLTKYSNYHSNQFFDSFLMGKGVNLQYCLQKKTIKNHFFAHYAHYVCCTGTNIIYHGKHYCSLNRSSQINDYMESVCLYHLTENAVRRKHTELQINTMKTVVLYAY